MIICIWRPLPCLSLLGLIKDLLTSSGNSETKRYTSACFLVKEAQGQRNFHSTEEEKGEDLILQSCRLLNAPSPESHLGDGLGISRASCAVPQAPQPAAMHRGAFSPQPRPPALPKLTLSCTHRANHGRSLPTSYTTESLTGPRNRGYYPHFTDEEMEAEKDDVSCRGPSRAHVC